MIYSHTYLYAMQPVLYRTYSFLLSQENTRVRQMHLPA